MPTFNTTSTDLGLDHHLSSPIVEQYVYPTFIAVAWCNALDLIVLCFNTFKRYSGPYFWSLLVASFCIIPFGLGYVLKIYSITFTNYFLEIAILDVGWSGMVTGQSLVLWSRLNLVLDNRRVLKALLYLIIVDGAVLHSSCTALEFATNALRGSHGVATAFDVMERVQLVGFCLQELLLSGLYIYKAVPLLKMDADRRSRGVLVQLIVINVVIMALDVSVVVVQYLGFFTFQVTFKALVYSIKLKLEYVILGRLVDVSRVRTPAAARMRL
ncbi:uncharacterized protein NFIA_044440 [Aspergillus fischeri NRRL 181]|uniref:DUF7703 domain-containing protein n=1 Tax=Neosartorya fischeri (strain ATCC 1020 / DSM 3700 / CBS 544.65 / FGSC A1164 / JCM 1740 / NRRL 181 / WB 181) TaxID=331117 RepID=A1CV48_NEOFI|nr:conserved hypothetical protein [Aspergillus fischeri NRRL 181]EAW25625.1 conserved hypothetical protein [Aspergillus fischeri NRRL 181]KAG2001591.1 hypothetical protein GB937_010033 [Aspergillus fischeri]